MNTGILDMRLFWLRIGSDRSGEIKSPLLRCVVRQFSWYFNCQPCDGQEDTFHQSQQVNLFHVKLYNICQIVCPNVQIISNVHAFLDIFESLDFFHIH